MRKYLRNITSSNTHLYTGYFELFQFINITLDIKYVCFNYIIHNNMMKQRNEF